jgi:CelD/BcsL family acetyltransferase involved in cellulose biosynthesis
LSVEMGLKEFDFGSGDEAYKAQYCNSEWRLAEAIRPCTSPGLA